MCGFSIIFILRRIKGPCFSSCKNRKLKVKMWLVGARERKKDAPFVPFVWPIEIIFYINV